MSDALLAWTAILLYIGLGLLVGLAARRQLLSNRSVTASPTGRFLMDILNRLGIDRKYSQPSEIFKEICTVTPSYAGISYDRLDESGSLQWPCPTTDHPGTKFLHGAKIARGFGLFKPAVFKPSAELPREEYPLIMTTGRVLYHYHTRTMTGKVAVSTRRGRVEATAKLTDKLKESVIFMPFHLADGAANTLTNPVLDPIAKIPEYKSCAARVAKI